MVPSIPAPTPDRGVWTVERVSAVLDHVRTAFGVLAARCPAHDDRWGTLVLMEVEPGDIAFHCSGGCPEKDIVSAVEVRMREG